MTISASYKVPGIFIEVVNGVGPVSAGDAPRRVCLVGHMLASGTLTADTPTQCFSKEDAATQAGAGSELHRMAIAAFNVDPACNLWLVGLTPPSGGTAASSSIVFSGTASADGTVTVLIGGVSYAVSIPSGTLAAAAAQLVIDAINDTTDGPVEATLSTATVVITYKHKSTRGNQLKASSSGTVAGLTITHASGSLSGGLGADTLTTAQANMATERFHIIGVAHDVTSDLQGWRTHVNACAAPLEGRRQAFVAASISALATATTQAIAINASRGQLAWHYNPYEQTGEIAAATAARRALDESEDPASPFSAFHGSELTGIRVQPVIADKPLASEVQSALNNGLTPIVSSASGICYIARGVTTRSQDVAGNPNYAVLDTAKVTVPDFVADDLAVNWSAFVEANPKLADDPADGSSAPEGVATPSAVKQWEYELLKVHEGEGLITRVDELKTTHSVVLATSPAGRTISKIPVDVVEGNYQADVTINQIG